MKPLFYTLAFFILIACDKAEKHCLQTDIARLAPSSIEEIYDCADTRYSLEIDLQDNYVLLNNKKDYDEKVGGSCHPDIDFEKYDLLIGKKQLQSGNHAIHYQLKEDCAHQQILIVSFYQNLTMVAPNITYHALLPKTASNNNIVIETEVIYNWSK
ncbi:MAG TPA: hypothetical protein VN040_07185 [Pseudosphingobacterium sp.]|nr:hypothetical protein [Pseudosphingobacterium sp.]